MGRLRPFAWHLSVTRSLVSICMPQGCDGVQVVALSIGPLCHHDITRSDRQIGNVSVTYVTLTLCPHATILNHRWLPGTRSRLLSVKPDEWMHLSPIIRVCTGSGSGMQNPLANIHWRFLLKSEMIGASK